MVDRIRSKNFYGIEYFFLGVIYQKYGELEPRISNVSGFSSCVMIESLRRYVKITKVSSGNVEMAKKLIQYFDQRCVEFWKDNPEMWIDIDNLPYSIPDYSNYEKYL